MRGSGEGDEGGREEEMRRGGVVKRGEKRGGEVEWRRGGEEE